MYGLIANASVGKLTVKKKHFADPMELAGDFRETVAAAAKRSCNTGFTFRIPEVVTPVCPRPERRGISGDVMGGLLEAIYGR